MIKIKEYKYTLDDLDDYTINSVFDTLNDAFHNLKNEDDLTFTPVYVQPYTSPLYDADVAVPIDSGVVDQEDSTKYKPNTINGEFIKERLRRENELESENTKLKEQIKLLEEKLKTNCK